MEFAQVYETYFPFWKDLSEEDRQILLAQSYSVSFERQQSVHDNTRCTGFFIVKTGRLRIYILSEEGKEITLYRLTPGEMCMLSASCVLSAITFDVYVEAEEPTECYKIAPQAFMELSQRIPAVKIFALEMAVTRFSDVMWVMQQLVFMSMDKRLAIFLLDELSITGGDTVTMTHDQIARHLGTAREVVSRVLKLMAADGMLEVSRKGIRITDKKKLQSIAY